MSVIYCVCCGKPFSRPTNRGCAPKYCSDDCRRQMAVRRSAWGAKWSAPVPPHPTPPTSGDD